EHRALRIRQKCKTTHAGNVLWFHMNLCAKGFCGLCKGVDIINAKIDSPDWPKGRAFGGWHDATDSFAIGSGKDTIVTPGCGGCCGRRPAHDPAIEGLCRIGRGGHQLVPDRGSVSIGHLLAPLLWVMAFVLRRL